METILITGGTGLIGTAITNSLVKDGYKVVVLSRNVINSDQPLLQYAQWNPEQGEIDKQAIKEADYIIHLAGANVAEGRWTEKRKQEIVDSRVKSGALLVKALREIPNKIQAIISASAIGWYGADPSIPNPNPFIETDPADTAFLGATCQKWEAAIEPVVNLGKRLVKLRIGIVLSDKGGAYKEFHKPLKFGVASVLGSGKQVVSWIHIDDLVRLFVYALKNETMNGIYNAVAPNPVTNEQLIKKMANIKGGPSVTAPVPSFVLKALLGEMSIEVLKSATVSSEKVQKAGFSFQYSTIESALKDLENKA
jgi:uncharacterized protein